MMGTCPIPTFHREQSNMKITFAHVFPLCMLLCLVGAGCATTASSSSSAGSTDAPASGAATAPGEQASAAGGVTLTTARAEFVRNERVSLYLTNGTDAPIDYNLCYSKIEMQVGAQWHIAEDFPDYCAHDAGTLAPGSQTEFGLILVDALPAGQYRIVTEVVVGGETRTMTTSPLTLLD